jgi:hypothetical protein
MHPGRQGIQGLRKKNIPGDNRSILPSGLVDGVGRAPPVPDLSDPLYLSQDDNDGVTGVGEDKSR